MIGSPEPDTILAVVPDNVNLDDDISLPEIEPENELADKVSF